MFLPIFQKKKIKFDFENTFNVGASTWPIIGKDKARRTSFDGFDGPETQSIEKVFIHPFEKKNPTFKISKF